VRIPRPPIARVDSVVDVVHGQSVRDPYRWLEDGESAETRAFVAAQNRMTRDVLDGLPVRAAVRARVTELARIGTVGTPTVRRRADGSLRYFYSRRNADQNQAVLYVRDGLRGADRIVIDPTTFTKDGTTALDWYYPSEDGSHVAYGLSEGGSEQSVLRIRAVDTGRDLPDRIEGTRACSLAWLPDGTAFYYTRYPRKGEVPDGERSYHRRVFFHRVGDAPSHDEPVFGAGRDMKDWPGVDLSPDGRYLVVTVFKGYTQSEVYLKDRSRADAPWVALAEGIDSIFQPTVYNDRILLRTNHEAPRYKVLSIDPADVSKRRTLVPEGRDVLEGMLAVGDSLFVTYMHDATSRLRRFDLASGADRGEVALPALGTLAGLDGLWNGRELFFGLTTFTSPVTVYRLGIDKNDLAVWERIDAAVRGDDYEVRQIRYASKDGTSIPMFLVHKKGLSKTGEHPAWLTGYGGFNVATKPYFLGAAHLFLERGGIIAVANLRGGNEYGEAWHRAGMRDKKQNVFDDFIAAAKWLIREKYTRPEKLAIAGGSNGGLLVGAAMVQRPDLFRAVVCSVPLLDMVRFHRFLMAKLWTGEYGSPEVKEEFRWLYAYSPYHHVKDGTAYPAVLLATGESDSRVDPLHARKMAARLQAATTSHATRPILLRLETRAGHGQGKPVTKLIDELTDRWSFILWQLGM
jgi:prolyl oligopeptidase